MKTGKEILQSVLEAEGMTVAEFAAAIGMKGRQGCTLYDLMRGRTLHITPRVVKIITEHMPHISALYLTTGEGEMYVGDAARPYRRKKTASKDIYGLLADSADRDDEIIGRLDRLVSAAEGMASLREDIEAMVKESARTRQTLMLVADRLAMLAGEKGDGAEAV